MLQIRCGHELNFGTEKYELMIEVAFCHSGVPSSVAIIIRHHIATKAILRCNVASETDGRPALHDQRAAPLDNVICLLTTALDWKISGVDVCFGVPKDLTACFSSRELSVGRLGTQSNEVSE